MAHRYIQVAGSNGVFVAGARGATITDVRFFSTNASGAAGCDLQMVTSATGTQVSSPSLDDWAPTSLTTYIENPASFTTSGNSTLSSAVGVGPQSDVAVIRQPIKLPPGEQLFVGIYPQGNAQAVVYFEE